MIFVSVALLSILIVLQVIRGSNNIVNNVHGNISDANNANKKRTQQEALLSELRQNFLKAQTNGIDRMSIIEESKKEIEKYLDRESPEDDQLTH